jgi:DDE domain
VRFKLSYRDLAELARELGVSVAPSTILRWVIRYVPEFEKCWHAYERPVGDSWRVDETYLKVGGQWMYLYRALINKAKPSNPTSVEPTPYVQYLEGNDPDTSLQNRECGTDLAYHEKRIRTREQNSISVRGS